MITNKKNSEGFTLIELMIAIAIGSIVIAGTVMLFHRQIMANNTQRLIVSMQQNIRAAVSFMERDIRMAAADPTEEARLNPDFPPPGIDIANSGVLQFTSDVDASKAAVTTRYELAGGNLLRNGQILARNIDALNFMYLDEDGNTTSDIPDIRSVQLSIVARSGDALPGLFFRRKDSKIYRNKFNETILPAQDDDFRRMQVTTEIHCRNIGT